MELRGDRNLSDKPLRPQRRSELGTQHLHRHIALVFDVAGEVDRGHTSRADFALDGVAAGKGGGEAGELVGHERIMNIESSFIIRFPAGSSAAAAP